VKYEKVELFGKQQSRGTFDDLFDSKKYQSIQEAYAANDYAQCDFVKDEEGILYIEAKNMKQPDTRKYHRLNYQRPVMGIDVSDDNAACDLAFSMLQDGLTTGSQ
jgi:hypothetical protein